MALLQTPNTPLAGAKPRNGQASATSAEFVGVTNQASKVHITPDDLAQSPRGKLDQARFEDVYPINDLLSEPVRIASKLLTDACRRLKVALETIDSDEIAADDQLHHVVADLREAFCLREIGDGFGTVVNAALASLENLGPSPVTVRQLSVLLRRLERVQTEPFMSLETALEEIDYLERAELNVEPLGFSVVEDWLLSGE